MTTNSERALHRYLGWALKLTPTDDVAITRAVNEAIQHAHPDEEDRARRRALIALAEAAARRARRCMWAAAATLRPTAATRYWSLRWDFTEYATALASAPHDGDADSIRTQLLLLHSPVNADSQIRAIASAMRRVSLAGTSAVPDRVS